MNKKDLEYLIYIIIAGIVYIGLALIQYFMGEKNFSYIGISIILFIISLVIGYLIQKIQSRQEFIENLKTKAYGAIRRLNDIETFINRGLVKISKHENVISEVIFEDIGDTIRSAQYDWADVIENDLNTIRELENKNRELLKIFSIKNLDAKTRNNQVEQLSNEIQSLQKNLPSSLIDIVDSNKFNEKEFFRLQEVINAKVNQTGKITLLIDILDAQLNEIIDHSKPLIFVKQNLIQDYQISSIYIEGDKPGMRIGEVLNPSYYPFYNDAIYFQVVYELFSENLQQARTGLLVDKYSIENEQNKLKNKIYLEIDATGWKTAVG